MDQMVHSDVVEIIRPFSGDVCGAGAPRAHGSAAYPRDLVDHPCASSTAFNSPEA